MSYKSRPDPILYHFSKDKRIRGRIVNTTTAVVVYIIDNKKESILIKQVFKLKEVREANVWMYEHLDCPLFTLLQSLPKQA